jgi:hypothetical protein
MSETLPEPENAGLSEYSQANQAEEIYLIAIYSETAHAHIDMILGFQFRHLYKLADINKHGDIVINKIIRGVNLEYVPKSCRSDKEVF